MDKIATVDVTTSDINKSGEKVSDEKDESESSAPEPTNSVAGASLK